MPAILLILGLVILPILLLILGLKTAATIAVIFAIFSVPSIIKILYLAIKSKSWPRIIDGLSITCATFKKGGSHE